MAGKTLDSRLPTAAMRVTTVRFGSDLWELLEYEAALVGTSVSQYIREASLARAAAAAAARGESPFERLASTAHGADKAKQARQRARLEHENARALQAQSSQAIAEATRKAERASRASRRRADRTAGDR